MGISKEKFNRIEHLLPRQRGNVRICNRNVLDAFLFIAENGCKWRALPKEFGNWHTIYTKINRWAKGGVLERIFKELRTADRNLMFLDSTSIKVHPHGVGALKKTEINQSENQEVVSPQKYISLLQANERQYEVTLTGG